MSKPTPDYMHYSKRQIIFGRYFMAILTDLTVLNLFNEFWDNVYIETFSISLLAAIVLQLMLQLTFKVEHGVGSHLQKKGRKGFRIFTAWALLFGSKFLILYVLELLFGNKLMFHGAYHGIVAFIIVVVSMIAAEAFIRWIIHTVLGNKESLPSN